MGCLLMLERRQECSFSASPSGESSGFIQQVRCRVFPSARSPLAERAFSTGLFTYHPALNSVAVAAFAEGESRSSIPTHDRLLMTNLAVCQACSSYNPRKRRQRSRRDCSCTKSSNSLLSHSVRPFLARACDGSFADARFGFAVLAGTSAIIYNKLIHSGTTSSTFLTLWTQLTLPPAAHFKTLHGQVGILVRPRPRVVFRSGLTLCGLSPSSSPKSSLELSSSTHL